MKLSTFPLLILALVLNACQDNNRASSTTEDATAPANELASSKVLDSEIKFQNKAHKLVYEMTQAAGDYSELSKKNDVTYTYTYTTADGKTDRVNEKYIFNGEKSYGAYQTHERTLPQLEGLIEQGYDGKSFWLRHEGKYLDDEAMMKRVAFNRKTNFYWFAMFQKLMDPGLNYDYVKEESINGNNYNVVKVSFESKEGKPTDIYQLWINPQTQLVDQFLFTVADFGVMDTPNLMVVEYEQVDGLMLPTTRKYTKGDWDGNNLNDQWIHVKWSNIQFDNKLEALLFSKR